MVIAVSQSFFTLCSLSSSWSTMKVHDDLVVGC